MLPSSNWIIAMVRIFCAPTVCCVQPKAYKKVPALSEALVVAKISQTFKKSAFDVPQICSTISGV